MKNDDGIAFAAGDRVFAKVKGFPPWPARITDIVDEDKNTFYNVEFYGTHESAKLKSSYFCFYLKNKAEIEQSIVEYPNENHLNCEMELFIDDKNDLVNSQLEEKNEELETKCTDIEKALQKEKSLRLEELELSVCLEADVEMDTEYETFDVEACFGDLEVRDSDIIRKRAIMTYLTYNKQYKELKEEIAKELIFNISGKGDFETNQSKEKIKIHERQPSHETCKITCNLISGMEKWSVLKRKSGQGRFNHRCSLMQDNTTSQTVTANKYSILDRLSEICTKENESYDKNHCIKNHIKKNYIGTDKSYSGKSKTGLKGTTFKFQFKMKVNLCSDSQGSLLSSKLEELSNGKVNCFGYVRANTTLTQVADSASLWDDTSSVILLGGSNDSLNGNFQNIYSNLELKLHHLSKPRPVFITTVPIRYDKGLSSVENNDLRLVNSYITELTNRLDDVFLINLSGFKRFHYTAHGLHLNNRGKSKLAYVILNALSWWQSRNKSGNLEKITTTNSKHEKCRMQPLNFDRLIGHSQNCINIVEGNMDYVITNLKHNEFHAFSHCISRDFNNDKNMSAGVAVLFRNHFGRPCSSDLLRENLTYQASVDRATVHGLVTKPNYYSKPSKTAYNEAFIQLTDDFKARKFKVLICTPMGCVRDMIPTEGFAENIVRFQRNTKASVIIITHDERSTKILRNGMSYSQFNIGSFSSENNAQDFEQMSEFPPLPIAKNFRRVQMEETAADGSSTQDDLTLQLPQVSSVSVESQSLLSNGLGINGPSVVEALDLSTAYCVNDSYDEDCNISVLSPCNSTNSDRDGSVFLGFSTPVNSCRKINVSKTESIPQQPF
ncbi:PC4 and SFRS1-interacting protein [Homalodisca vitripennis]|nr:PC4 and SFRS1-interacting protein [Homalodisca vitripennis]